MGKLKLIDSLIFFIFPRSFAHSDRAVFFRFLLISLLSGSELLDLEFCLFFGFFVIIFLSFTA